MLSRSVRALGSSLRLPVSVAVASAASVARLPSLAPIVPRGISGARFSSAPVAAAAAAPTVAATDAAAAPPAVAADTAATPAEPKKGMFARFRERRRAASLEKKRRSYFPRRFYRYTALSVASLWTLDVAGEYAIGLLRDLHASQDAIELAFYTEGAVHALAVLGLIKAGGYILSLGGKPSEPVIQDIMAALLRRDAVKAVLGANLRAGHVSTYAYTDNGVRVLNSRSRDLAQWLRLEGKGELVDPAPVPLWRRLFGRGRKPVSAGDAVAAGAAGRGVDDPTVEVVTTSKDIDPTKPGGARPVTAAADTPAAAVAPATAATTDAATAGAGTTAAEDTESVAAAVKRAKNASDYSGWGRIWRARRLQLVMHVVGDKDSALVLAEVEKKHTGWGVHTDGFTDYRTLQVVSLTTGKVTTLEGPEKPTLLSNAHLTRLFETIPKEADTPVV